MYNLYYNLNDRPFDLKPELKYFYPTRPHKQAIQHILDGFKQDDGVLILTGEKGLGKTTLIAYMLDHLDKNDNLVALIEKPPQKDLDFLPAVLDALKIPSTERQPKVLFSTLHKYALEQAKLNKNVLLVVDNAEALSPNCLEIIRLLATLRLNKHSLLQIVLIGTKELDTVLSTNENQIFRQQISVSYCMQPLQVSDTREYIEHRLKVAGWKENPVIDADAYSAIHQLTGGVPCEINRYCDRLLMLGMLRETRQIGANDVSDLTAANMEKLDKLEAARLEKEKRTDAPEASVGQSFPPHRELKKGAPARQATHGIGLEKFVFNTPAKTATRSLNKQTIRTIAAACLIAPLSIFFYDKISESSQSTTDSAAHSLANGHSAHEEIAVTHESSLKTAKYILEEIPATSGIETVSDSNAPGRQLLDIQLLLTKFGKSNSELKSDQFDGSFASMN